MYCGSWIGRLNIVKMSIFPKFIFRFNVIPIKMSAGYFVDIDKLILRFTWKSTGSRINKTIFKKRINWGKLLYSILK